MIKNANKILLGLALLLMLPFVMLLTGCGATPINNVKAVYFESNLYDEETGYAIFEVDLNIETELKFKINPSSWSGYKPTYAVIKFGESEKNRSRFRLEYGKIIVLESTFEEITVRIEVNGLSDTCIVRLKQYPTEIYLTQDTRLTECNDYINANGTYNIHIFGKFVTKDAVTKETVEEIREITDDIYKFNVESADDTIIYVLDSSRLKVCALKSKIESTTVTIKLLDTTGNLKDNSEKFILKLKLSIVLPPSTSYVKFDCYNKFITNGDEIDLDLTALNLGTEVIGNSTYYTFDYIVELFSSMGVYISSEEYTITATSNQDSFIRIDNSTRTIKVRKPANTNTLTAELEFYASANQVTGESYSLSFLINFIFPIE